MHHVERAEQGRRHRHGPEHAGAALLQALYGQHAGGQVDAIGGQRQRLGQPAPGVSERHAQGPHLAVGQLGLAQEGVALAGGEVFARAACRVQPHGGLRGRGWRFLGDARSRARGALAGGGAPRLPGRRDGAGRPWSVAPPAP